MTKKLTKVAMTTALAAAAIVPAVVATPAQAAEAEVTFAKAYYTTANGTAAFDAGKLGGVVSATGNKDVTYLEGSNGEVFEMKTFSAYFAANPTATTDEVLTALSKAGKALSADQVKALDVKEGKVDGDKVTVDPTAVVKTALEEAIAKAEASPKVAELKDAIAAAKAVAENADATQAEVDAAVKALNEAVAEAEAVKELKVESVKAINVTTAEVTLAEAKADATAADFKVLVDGTEVTPSKVTVKEGSEDKVYVITHASLDNKAGTLSVNGKEVTFDYKAPKVTKVEAANKKTVVVTFENPVDKVTAETPANYVLNKIVGTLGSGSNTTPEGVSLSADGLTATLTLKAADTFVDAPGGYTLTLKDIKSAANAKVLAQTERIFDGNSAEDTSAAQITNVIYDPTAGEVTVEFNKPVAATDFKVKEELITVKGAGADQSYTLTEDAYTKEETKATKLVFKVPASVKEFTAPLTLSVAEGAFETENGELVVAVEKSIVSSASPEVVSAAYDENTSKLTFVTNKEIKASDIDVTKIEVSTNGSQYKALAAANSKVTVTGTTVTVDVGEVDAAKFEAATVTSANVKFKKDALKDATAKTNAEKVVTLAYTDDKTAPTFVGASYNDLTNEFILEFSEPIDLGTIKHTDGTVVDGAVVLSGKKQDGTDITAALLDSEKVFTTKNDKKIVIDVATLADVAELLNATDLKVSIKANTIKDKAGNALAEVKDVAVTYIDKTPVSITTPANDAKAKSNKVVTVKFDDDVDAATAQAVANYTLKQAALGVSVAPIKAILLSDKRTVELTFAEEFQNVLYTLDISTNIKDTAGNSYVAPTNAVTFQGVRTADTTGPQLVANSYKYTDNGDFKLGAGDTIELQFDKPLNVADWTKVTEADFALNGKTLGKNAKFAQGSGPDKLLITLGTGSTLEFGGTINVATDNNITDAAGNKATAANQQTIANPGKAPLITGFSYADTNANGEVGLGDKVVITYDRNIDVVGAITAADFTFGAGFTVGNATYEKTAANQITITLATNSTITWDSTATVDEGVTKSTTIFDAWGVAQAVADNNTVTLKSDDKTNPTLQSVKIVKGDGKTGAALEDGDKVEITLSEAVHADAAAAAGAYVLYSGATPYAYDKAAIVVTGNKVTITVATGDAWVDKTISALSTFNFNASLKSVLDASGNAVTPATGFGVTVEK